MTNDARPTTLGAPHHLTVTPPTAPRRGHLDVGESPSGDDRIEVTSTWLERGGNPWFPITGEIHYSRIPRDRWRDVLGHARAGGLTSVATYVFWQAHEPAARASSGGTASSTCAPSSRRRRRTASTSSCGWARGPTARHGTAASRTGSSSGTSPPAPTTPRTSSSCAPSTPRPSRSSRACRTPTAGRWSAPRSTTSSTTSPSTWHACASSPRSSGSTSRSGRRPAGAARRSPRRSCPCTARTPTASGTDEQTEWPEFSAFHFRYSPVRDDLSVGADLREALDGITLDPDAVPLKDDDAVPVRDVRARWRDARRVPPQAARRARRRRRARPRQGRQRFDLAGLLHVRRRDAADRSARLGAGVPRDRLPQRRATGDLRLRTPRSASTVRSAPTTTTCGPSTCGSSRTGTASRRWPRRSAAAAPTRRSCGGPCAPTGAAATCSPRRTSPRRRPCRSSTTCSSR